MLSQSFCAKALGHETAKNEIEGQSIFSLSSGGLGQGPKIMRTVLHGAKEQGLCVVVGWLVISAGGT